MTIIKLSTTSLHVVNSSTVEKRGIGDYNGERGMKEIERRNRKLGAI